MAFLAENGEYQAKNTVRLAQSDHERDKNSNGKRYATVWYGIVDKIGLPTVFYQKVLLDHLLNYLDVKLISADF